MCFNVENSDTSKGIAFFSTKINTRKKKVICTALDEIDKSESDDDSNEENKSVHYFMALSNEINVKF